MIRSMLLPLRRYADFAGRSRRREYWLFQLFVLLVLLAALVAMMLADPGRTQADIAAEYPVWGGFALLPLIIPLLAVTVRRLHDLGWAGWWLIPLILGGAIPAIDSIVAIVYLVIMALPGSKRDNRFGPSLRSAAPA